MATETKTYWFDPLTAVVTNGAVAGADGITNVPSIIVGGPFGIGGAADGELGNPMGCASDESGNVYIYNLAQRALVKFSPSGVFLGKVAIPGAGVSYGSLGQDRTRGEIWLGDYGGSIVYSYDYALNTVTNWATAPRSNPYACCYCPDTDTVLVAFGTAYLGNYEIVEYTRAGVLVAVRESQASANYLTIGLEANTNYVWVARYNINLGLLCLSRHARPFGAGATILPGTYNFAFIGAWPPSDEPLPRIYTAYGSVAYRSDRIYMNGTYIDRGAIWSATETGTMNRIEVFKTGRKAVAGIIGSYNVPYPSICVGGHRVWVTSGYGGSHQAVGYDHRTGIGTHINNVLPSGAVLTRILFAGCELECRRSANQAGNTVIEWRVGGAGAWTAVDLDSPATLAQAITSGIIEIRARLNTFSGVDALPTDTHGVIDKSPPKVRLGFVYEVAKVLTVFHGPLKMHIDRGSIMGLGS